MDTLFTVIGSAFAGGFLSTLFGKFFMSKKEKKDYELTLIATLGSQVERLAKKYDEVEKELIEYKQKYDSLLLNHNELKGKHEALKKEITELKKTHPNFQS